MAEWITRFVEFPNPECNSMRTTITIDGFCAEYWHVESGYKVDRIRKNSKLYSSEAEIRHALLKVLLARARKATREIKAAIDKTFTLTETDEGPTGCLDDTEYELSDALKRISPQRLNELLDSSLER